LTIPQDITYGRYPGSKFWPDTSNRTYTTGSRLAISSSSSPTTISLNFGFSGYLRRVSILPVSGSLDGDFFSVSGSNRSNPYAEGIYVTPSGIGLTSGMELGEKFTAGSNTVYFTYFPAASETSIVYTYFYFLRDDQ
jgi:hypothetical protein